LGAEIGETRSMANLSKNGFIKFEKELKGNKKAKEKLARRQGKNDQGTEVDRT
jgi:hypothetical protein